MFSFRRRTFSLAGRGAGALAALELGPTDRAVDLVFLHANGFNALTYRALLTPLAPRWRILAVDQRGHGLTSLTTDTQARANWHDFRDDLVALLALLETRDVVLAGHSMGGTTALLTAARSPERARQLVLFDPVISPPRTDPPAPKAAHATLIHGAHRRRAAFPSRAAALDAYRGRGAFKTWPEAVLADYVADGFRDLPDGGVTLACAPDWEASTYASQDHDPWRAFADSRCPIHILRAERDSTCRVEGRVGELTASGRIAVETVAGTTHFLPMERPELARGALEAALKAG